MITKEYLTSKIIEEKLSYEEIGRQNNMSGNGIKKMALKLGIELPKKRKINPKEKFNIGKSKDKNKCLNCGCLTKNEKFCSNKCQAIYNSNLNYKKFLESPKELQRSNYNCVSIKPFILKEQDNKCSICNCENIHNNKLLVFVLDHIDGNASNNVRENLRLVCPNCDSQLDTYKSKNKNSARINRYKKED